MDLRGELFYIKQLGLRMLGLLFVWMICRIAFYAFNVSAFPVDNFFNFGKLLFFGIRFDLAALTYVNLLLILSYILPFPFRKNLRYQKFQKFIFISINAIALFFEVGDMAYFRFAFRRTIGSDLNLMRETTNMAGQFFYDFWYLFLFYFFMLFLLNFIYKKTTFSAPPPPTTWWLQSLLMPVVAGLSLIALRGGVQLRPIMSLTSAQYVDDMRLMPLQSNTTLNLLFSVQQNFIEEKNYLSKSEEANLFSIEKNPKPTTPFKKENVFLIVLESFGKEHIGFFNSSENDSVAIEKREESVTPFLDSLIRESWYFENAYAVGTRSTQGIAAISASIPALMDNALMFSPYQGNRLDGIAAHLKKKGYSSGFFHGSNPGSMEFERFSKLTGYEKFYDRTAYPDQKDYDGNWGIWDVPFFQFTAKEVDEYPQPFNALIFSLSSHHPYHVEPFFEKKYPAANTGREKLRRAMRYTDYALQQFFETAKKMDWYENTLFVITADHLGKVTDKKYATMVGRFQIPLLFYKPNSDLRGKYSGIVQQTDILPTVLDYLNFDKPYTAFGQSAFDSLESRNAYMYDSGIYQILDDSLLLSFDQKNTIGIYNYRDDPFLKNDLKDKMEENSGDVKALLENKLKAVVQKHHRAMIRNRLVGREE